LVACAARRTLGAVIGDLTKRVVNAAVLFIAAIAFFLVPVGRRTLAQHVAAIVSTPPAREAAEACADAGRRVVRRAGAEIKAIRQPKPPPAPSAPVDLDPAD
jgi:hypothetical protein